jgi:chromosome segregation ATPase
MAERSDNPKAHHRILSLEATGGFLKNAKFEFADGLNCIIGGRGTGKTTVLEFIRYVLGMMPEEKATPTRARAIRALVQSNLGTGRIRLNVKTKHGVGYLAERPWNDSCQVLNEQGEPTVISFDRDLIFKADVYSQNEIEEIATNPSFQLALLDKFKEEDVRRIDAEIQKVHRDLGHNAAEILRLDREMRDLRDSASEVEILDEKLKALQQTTGPDAKLVNAAHAQKALRDKERKTLEALRGDLRKGRTDLDTVVAGFVRRVQSRIDADIGAGPNKDIFGIVAQHVQELAALLEGAASKVGQQTEATDGVVAEQERTLAERHAKQDAEYREFVAKSQEETGRATERMQLQERAAEVSTAKKELELRQKERREREAQRQELTAKLSGLRDERFGLRKSVADQLSDALQPTIRVTITQAGNRDGYRSLLTEAPFLLDRVFDVHPASAAKS